MWSQRRRRCTWDLRVKLGKDIKGMDIDEEAPINEESLMDMERDKDLHLEDHGMMDMFLEGHGMVAISLGIVAETRLGGDRIPEEKMSLDVIDHELQTRLQTLRDVLGVDAKLVNKLRR